jgi:hypothetical protein
MKQSASGCNPDRAQPEAAEGGVDRFGNGSDGNIVKIDIEIFSAL